MFVALGAQFGLNLLPTNAPRLVVWLLVAGITFLYCDPSTEVSDITFPAFFGDVLAVDAYRY
jgi:hypothetical protein